MAQTRNYKFTLAANAEINPSLEGRFIRCYEGDAPFTVYPDDKNPCELQKGIGISFGRNFSRVRIKNGATAQTLELYIGPDEVLDNRLVTTGGVRINGNSTGGAPAAATVGVAAAQILAANTSRGSALLFNNSANTIYVGVDNTLTVANGIPLGGGQSMEISHQSAIWGIAAVAGNDVRVQEETN